MSSPVMSLVATQESVGPLALSPAEERRLRRRLRRWAGRFFGLADDEFAEAYQQAWERVIRLSRQDRPVRNLEHALRWEVGNAWRQELRRRRPTRPLDETSECELARADRRPDVHEQVEQLDAARYLLRATHPRRVQVLLMRDVCGLTTDQICDRLGISEATVRRDRAAALSDIYHRLEELVGGSAQTQGAFAPRRASATPRGSRAAPSSARPTRPNVAVL
jgi:RNA polymerase sigma factor (sigma-70 family)